MTDGGHSALVRIAAMRRENAEVKLARTRALIDNLESEIDDLAAELRANKIIKNEDILIAQHSTVKWRDHLKRRINSLLKKKASLVELEERERTALARMVSAGHVLGRS